MASQSTTLHLFRVKRNSITEIRFNTTQIFASNFSLLTFLLFFSFSASEYFKNSKNSTGLYREKTVRCLFRITIGGINRYTGLNKNTKIRTRIHRYGTVQLHFLNLCLISFFVLCITFYFYCCIYFVVDLWQSTQVHYTTLHHTENKFHHTT